MILKYLFNIMMIYYLFSIMLLIPFVLSNKIIGVYKILNRYTGKCYIGHSKDVEKRLKNHINDLENGKHCNKKFQNSYDYFRRRGFNTILFAKLLNVCKTVDEAQVIEQIYLDELSIRDYLYNLIFDPIRAEEKFSKNKTTLPNKNDSKKKTTLPNKRNELIINDTEYASIAEASRQLNIPSSTIRGRLKSTSFDNYNYKYKSDEDFNDSSLIVYNNDNDNDDDDDNDNDNLYYLN